MNKVEEKSLYHHRSDEMNCISWYLIKRCTVVEIPGVGLWEFFGKARVIKVEKIPLWLGFIAALLTNFIFN